MHPGCGTLPPMHSEKMSPITKPPRRQAGQSLRERLTLDVGGYIFYAGGALVATLMLVGVTWTCWLMARPVTPWATTGAAVLILGLLVADLAPRLRRARNYRLGLQGELHTAEWLGELARSGYRVFHDLQGERGNIDHIAVGPAGVLVIETKTRSKSKGAKVRYDGARLLVGDWDATEQFLGQARACRDDVRRRLREYSEIAAQIPVRAVVAIPGWKVEERHASGAEVWVLNPKDRIAAWAVQEERWAGSVSQLSIDAASAMLDAWSRR